MRCILRRFLFTSQQLNVRVALNLLSVAAHCYCIWYCSQLPFCTLHTLFAKSYMIVNEIDSLQEQLSCAHARIDGLERHLDRLECKSIGMALQYAHPCSPGPSLRRNKHTALPDGSNLGQSYMPRKLHWQTKLSDAASFTTVSFRPTDCTCVVCAMCLGTNPHN